MANHPYPWREPFLAALRNVPVISSACTVVGINRVTVHRLRRADPAFEEDFLEAMEEGVDKAEAEAFRRAVQGFHEPVIHQGRLSFLYERYLDDDGKEQYRQVLDAAGQPVPLTTIKHSDSLMALILKGRRKKVYAERTELTGADGAPLEADDTSRATRVAALLKAAADRKALDDLV